MYLSGANPSITVHIPDGPDGVRATLETMANMLNDQKRDPQLRAVAASLVATIPDKDYMQELIAVHRYVRDTIRYLRDVHDDETVQTPVQTMFIAQGDCDDQATLVGTLLASIGFPVRFVAVGFYKDKYQHVYAEAYVDGMGWVPVETTEDVAVGWAPPGIFARMVQDA